MTFDRRDRILGAYAPLGLMATLAAWLALVLTGFSLIFWGTEHTGWRTAFDLSGSSLFTLGFAHPEHLAGMVLDFLEAAIGLFLLALLITYLPSIYSAYSRREVGITALEVRAGSPPSAREMIGRYWRLERMPRSTRSGSNGSAGSWTSRRRIRLTRRSSSSVRRTQSTRG